jgi:hypothetical protein
MDALGGNLSRVNCKRGTRPKAAQTAQVSHVLMEVSSVSGLVTSLSTRTIMRMPPCIGHSSCCPRLYKQR